MGWAVLYQHSTRVVLPTPILERLCASQPSGSSSHWFYHVRRFAHLLSRRPTISRALATMHVLFPTTATPNPYERSQVTDWKFVFGYMAGGVGGGLGRWVG